MRTPALCLGIMAIALIGCRPMEEARLAKNIGGKLPTSVSAVTCEPASGGQRKCVVEYDFATGDAKFEVQVAAGTMPAESFSYSHEPGFESDLVSEAPSSDFRTSVDTRLVASDVVIEWSDALMTSAVQAAEEAGRARLQALRQKDAVRDSYRNLKPRG